MGQTSQQDPTYEHMVRTQAQMPTITEQHPYIEPQYVVQQQPVQVAQEQQLAQQMQASTYGQQYDQVTGPQQSLTPQTYPPQALSDGQPPATVPYTLGAVPPQPQNAAMTTQPLFGYQPEAQQDHQQYQPVVMAAQQQPVLMGYQNYQGYPNEHVYHPDYQGGAQGTYALQQQPPALQGVYPQQQPPTMQSVYPLQQPPTITVSPPPYAMGEAVPPLGPLAPQNYQNFDNERLVTNMTAQSSNVPGLQHQPEYVLGTNTTRTSCSVEAFQMAPVKGGFPKVTGL